MGNSNFFDSKFCDACENYQRSFNHLNGICGRWIEIRRTVLNTILTFFVYFLPILIRVGEVGNEVKPWSYLTNNSLLSFTISMMNSTRGNFNGFIKFVIRINKIYGIS